MRIEIQDLTGCGADLIVIQEAGIPGPQGLTGSLELTTIVPPLTYDPPTYTLKIQEGTVVGQTLRWNGTEWVPGPAKRLEYRTITAGEEAAKELALAHDCTEPDYFLFDIADGGGSQFPEADFVIVGNTLRWEGKTLDGVLGEGDRVRFVYQ